MSAARGICVFLLVVATMPPVPTLAAGGGVAPSPGELHGIPLSASRTHTGHDVTEPEVMRAAAAQAAAVYVGSLPTRTPVIPLHPRLGSGNRTVYAAQAVSGRLGREVFGFANAGNLGSSSVGYTTWNFSLVSTVAYFGLVVNADGSISQSDTGWAVWHSSVASGLINAAHGNGVRVVISLLAHTQSTLCSTLSGSAIQTTVSQTASQLLGADGVNLDYEGANQTCLDGVSLRAKVDQLARAFRARGLGYLSIDTYASSAEDPAGFFDIPTLAASVDSLFVMDYGLDTSNGPCSTCMGATSPLGNDRQNAYPWNVTRSATDYAPWAGQTILGFPYYGVKGCVTSTSPNAQITSGTYGADPYSTIVSYPADPNISSWSESRDALDPAGQEPWASFSSAYANCTRDEYWDDAVSLAHKYDLVNQGNFRGAGIFTLDYGGGASELWAALASRFAGTRQYFAPANGYSSVLVNADGHLEAFFRQTGGAVVHSWQGNWGIWYPLASGAVMQTAPIAGLNADGRAEAVAVGSDGVVYHTWQPNWPAWVSLATPPSGVTFAGQPALTRNLDGRLEVFARGSDGAYWHGWQLSAGGWSAWASLGGDFASDPSVAQNAGDGHLEVFGRNGGGNVLHAWFSQGLGWSTWYQLGSGALSSKAVVARNPTGALEVFAIGSDGHLSHQWQVPGQGWSGWTDVGGRPGGGGWQGDPGIVANPNGALEVFLRGSDNGVWHSWQPSWGPYYSLGGLADSSPVVVLEQLYPTLTVWVNGVGTHEMYEQWRNPDSSWSGWQSRGGDIAVP
jgi:hypothetical protein